MRLITDMQHHISASFFCSFQSQKSDFQRPMKYMNENIRVENFFIHCSSREKNTTNKA